jgi:hypothetical protein
MYSLIVLSKCDYDSPWREFRWLALYATTYWLVSLHFLINQPTAVCGAFSALHAGWWRHRVDDAWTTTKKYNLE